MHKLLDNTAHWAVLLFLFATGVIWGVPGYVVALSPVENGCFGRWAIWNYSIPATGATPNPQEISSSELAAVLNRLQWC